jgi:hypothetical protein
MEIDIPASLKTEHDQLHAELEKATRSGGRTAAAAKAVARLLHPHFLKEEEYALPPLGILQHLAKGFLKPDMREVLAMTENLRKHLPEMINEHKQIVFALEDLMKVAKEENKPDMALFAHKLMMHARSEEEVTYPTAILIGEYLKMKLEK